MQNRQFSFLAVVLWGLLAPLVILAGASPLWAQFVPGPKLTIVNKSGYPASQICLVFLASANSDNNVHRIHWQHGEFLATFPVIDQTDNAKEINGIYYADYSVTLDKLPQDANGNHYFSLPFAENTSVPDNQKGIYSGRLWLSFKTPVYIHVDSATAHSQPNITNASDPNYTTVFDFFEPAITADGVVHADTTNVDSVAMPLLYELKNGATSLGKKGLACSLNNLRQSFKSTPLFSALVTKTAIVAPGHGIDMGLFPPNQANYFDNYVNYCWQHWQDTVLSFQYDGITWSGQVDGSTHQLKLTGTVDGASEYHYIDKPPSKDIFYCNGVFNGVNGPAGSAAGYKGRDADLKNQVASALNRTVMHLAPYPTDTITEFPWESYKPPNGSGGNLFYQQNGLANANYQSNGYSKILHALYFDGTIYGFAYDDNAKQASYIDGKATDIILTINNCRSNIAPVLNLLNQ